MCPLACQLKIQNIGMPCLSSWKRCRDTEDIAKCHSFYGPKLKQGIHKFVPECDTSSEKVWNDGFPEITLTSSIHQSKVGREDIYVFLLCFWDADFDREKCHLHSYRQISQICTILSHALFRQTMSGGWTLREINKLQGITEWIIKWLRTQFH